MRLLRHVVVVFALLLTFSSLLEAGIAPHNVAVVVNTDSLLGGKSVAVGRYYCAQAGIPPSNLIEVQTARVESATPTEYAKLAEDIRNQLVTQIGVYPDDPANDPIQVLVLCYGVPFRLPDSGTSVDSWLTLLFNEDPDVGPGEGALILENPYDRRNDWYQLVLPDVNFACFRASAENTTGVQNYKMRYLVCRLDGYSDPTVDVPGYGTMPKDVKDMIDRAAASEGELS